MKPIVVDYRNRTISLSSAFEKKAFTPGTAEYAQLQAVRSDFPGFRLDTRQFKTNTKQDRHKGLNYTFMREYISTHEKDAKPVLEVLDDMIETSKGHSLSRRYPTIKKWFLKRYPAYAEFGMTEKELTKWREDQKQEDKVIKLTANAHEDAPLPDAVNT